MTSVSADRTESSDVAQHLARTAACLFARRGYDATSVREIVEASGVTKPTLYYHFGSKEGLAQALLNRPLEGLVERLEALAVLPGEPVALLEQVLEVHFSFCREDPDRARFYYSICVSPHDSHLTAELMKFGPRLDAPIDTVIGRLTAEGIVPPARANDLLCACRGTIKSSVMEYLYRFGDGKEFDLGPALAGRLVGDLLWGFAAPGVSGRGKV